MPLNTGHEQIEERVHDSALSTEDLWSNKNLENAEEALERELEKDAEDSIAVVEEGDDPNYVMDSEDPTGIYFKEIENDEKLESFIYRRNKGSDSLLEEETPKLKFGRILEYDPEEEELSVYRE